MSFALFRSFSDFREKPISIGWSVFSPKLKLYGAFYNNGLPRKDPLAVKWGQIRRLIHLNRQYIACCPSCPNIHVAGMSLPRVERPAISIEKWNYGTLVWGRRSSGWSPPTMRRTTNDFFLVVCLGKRRTDTPDSRSRKCPKITENITNYYTPQSKAPKDPNLLKTAFRFLAWKL
jgi:hypothetical protein